MSSSVVGFSNLFHGFLVQRRQSTGPVGLVTVGRGRRRRRHRRSRFRPCLPLLSGFSNLFHGFPFVILYWFHFV